MTSPVTGPPSARPDTPGMHRTAGHPPLQILAEIAAEKNSTIVFPPQFLDSARALARFVAEERAPARADGDGAALLRAPLKPTARIEEASTS
ncbi:hypothetical protein AB0A71_36790 [Kitasatospora aureofaciens]|uniref:hypothetical protein n=1 Tax=Kitasatospora aureofaciens TaxID=1894 RepID=UPI00340E61A2